MKRLMLKISRFKLLGSDGSATFGCPISVEERPDLHSIITKLNVLISVTGMQSEAPADAVSPIRSQVGNFGDRYRSSSPPSSTLPVFATQVFGGTYRGENIRRASPTAHPQGRSFELLSLLQAQKLRDPPAGKNKTGQVGEIGQKDNINEAINPSVLRSMNSERMVEMSSRLGENADRQHSQRSLQLPHSSDIEEQVLLPTDIKTPTTNSLHSDDSEKENSEESSLREKSGVHEALRVDSAAEHDNPVLPILALDEVPVKDVFEGLKRVPRSYVRVPESQQTLLKRKDSWFQPDNGNRSSYANNIPPGILEDLSLFANRLATNGANESSHSNWPRRELGPDGDDNCSEIVEDIHEVEAESGNNKEINHMDDASVSEKDRTLNGPDLSGSRVYQENGPRLVNLIEAKGTHTIDAEIEKSNQLVDYDDEEMSEERGRSWSPSPKHSPRPYNSPILESPNPPLPSSSADVEIDIDELPEVCDTDRSAIAVPASGRSHFLDCGKAAKTRNLPYSAFPSSSLCSEDEIQMELSHAIDEPIDDPVDESEEEFNSPVTSQAPPSTTLGDGSIVQVDYTPCTNLRRSANPGDEPKPHKSRKRQFNEISSDHVVPATCEDGSSQEHKPSRVEDELKNPCTSSDEKLRSTDELFLITQSYIDDGSAVQGKDDMADNLSLTELEGTRLISSTQGEPPSRLQEVSEKSMVATPDNSSKEDIEPLLPPQSRGGDRRFEAEVALNDESSPRVPQSPKQGTTSLVHAQRNHRGRGRKFNFKFSQEEYATRDTDEMVRASRRDFNARLAASKAEASHLIPRSGMPTSITTNLDSDPATNLTPSEVPNTICSHPIADTPAISQAQVTPPAESLLERGSDSYHILRSQMTSTQGDKGESTRQPVSIDVESVNTSSVPVPANLPSAFEKFKSIYPSYQGNEERFIKGLVYIEWLARSKGTNFLRRSLWDDLMRILADDYLEYIRDSSISGKKMSGFEYYNEIDQDPVFKRMIITPSNLQDSLSSLDRRKVGEVRKLFNVPEMNQGDRDSPATFSPLTLQSLSSTPSTHQPREQEAGNDLYSDGNSLMRNQESSPGLHVLGVAKDKVSKPLYFETHSQPRIGQPENSPTTPLESNAGSHVETPKSAKRVLPWTLKEGTVVSPKIRSQPSGTHIAHNNSKLPSGSPNVGLRAREKVLNPDAGPEARTGSPVPSARNKDRFGSPSVRALKISSRRTTSLPNTRAEGRSRMDPRHELSSARKREFLKEFGRRRRMSGMSSVTSTPGA
jgi:hypothetical protein